MTQKRISYSFLLVVFLLISVKLNAQQAYKKPFNANPDPNGEPWIVGGLPPMTPKILAELMEIPELDLSHRAVRIPYKLNNAEQKYFRTIFNQSGGSCSQAAGVSYNFTYEVNFERGTTASGDANLFPTHYTWNFLNGGTGSGSSYVTGYQIIKENGCPTVQTWGGIAGSDTKWMSGYDDYYPGMQYRVKSYNRIDISTPEGLETLKQWMNDHGDGSTVGGLANFGVDFSGASMITLPSGTEEAGKKVITSWGDGGGHSMTFVGYNDSIRHDINNDNIYTNDVDINSDGIVDMKDWEIGGLYFANSHGTGYGDQGFAYMMYRLCAMESADGGIYGGGAYVIRAAIDHKTALTYKISMRHDSRSNIKISAGLSNNPDDEEPEDEYHYPLFNNQGGDHPMQGSGASEEIVIGLDVSGLRNFINAQKAKYFLIIDSRGGNGTVESFSLLDYRGSDVTETVSDQTNVAINQGRTLLSLIYESEVIPLLITTEELPVAEVDKPYTCELKASGGTAPYKWSVMKTVFNEDSLSASFPAITAEVTLSDSDDAAIEQDLAFSFPFYGEEYSKIYICTDGHILLSSGFQRVRTRQALKKVKSIAVLGCDLFYEAGDKIYFTGDQSSATIRWNTKHMYGGVEVNLDFAARLYPNGEIEYYYAKDLTDDITQMVIGISDGAGSYHIVDITNTTNIPDDHAFKLSAEGFPAGMQISANGIFSGTPTEADKSWKLMFLLTDTDSICKSKMLTFATIDSSSIVDNENKHFTFKTHSLKRSGKSIVFSFQIPEAGMVKLEIFNLAGREVKTFQNIYNKAGNYSTRWHNGTFTAGMYLCKLTLGNQAVKKKFILLKR